MSGHNKAICKHEPTNPAANIENYPECFFIEEVPEEKIPVESDIKSGSV